MFFERAGKEIVTALIRRFFTPYVENVDMERVTYGIRQGKLVLHGISLRPEAFDKFNLPVHIQGQLQTLTLSVPWRSLGKAPAQLYLDDVFIIVRPVFHVNGDLAEEAAKADAAKLERLEDEEFLYSLQAKESTNKPRRRQGISQWLIAKFMRNTRVTISKLHIRYEDILSLPEHPFSAGLTIDEITAQTVDEKWELRGPARASDWSYTTLKTRALALYLDTGPLETTNKSRTVPSTRFQPDTGALRQFILHPLDVEAKVAINHETVPTRFNVDVLLDRIDLTLDNEQYRAVAAFVDELQVYLRRRKYRELWPGNDDCTSCARRRLLFAGNAILSDVRERHRRWTWTYFAERRTDRLLYVHLFRQRLAGALGAEVIRHAPSRGYYSYVCPPGQRQAKGAREETIVSGPASLSFLGTEEPYRQWFAIVGAQQVNLRRQRTFGNRDS
ncbi:hypothetical protein HGRIS_007910 [Hohenbuehelia grisea]|uniref:Chorein N-terminal domain-containing protein n=1 Tax=Hohenbuehelia grisea TaxID=104357 RepID=A0ABR3J6T0_9AGAR